MLLTWIDGTSFDTALKNLPQKEQYELGLQAGRILKEIHSVEVDDRDIPFNCLGREIWRK